MSQTKPNQTTPSTKMPYQSPKITKLGGVSELTETSPGFGSDFDGGTSSSAAYAS